MNLYLSFFATLISLLAMLPHLIFFVIIVQTIWTLRPLLAKYLMKKTELVELKIKNLKDHPSDK